MILISSIILVAPQFVWAAASSQDAKKTVEAVEKEFNLEPRSVRPGHAMLPTTYIEKEGDIYYYVIPRRLRRLSEAGERFTWKKTRFKSDYVGIEFQSESGAKLDIRIYSEKEMNAYFYESVVTGAMRDLFDFGEQWTYRGMVANTRSQVVHLPGANHLPPPEQRSEFENLQDAEAAGFVPCSICFEASNWIPMEGYITIRKAAIEASRTREIIYPPVEDDIVQMELQKLGEMIVADFPIKVMGYTYVFKVLHSEIPWAESFPTGFVFVSDRLLEMVEDPRELEFILAHEIAHVELIYNDVSFDPWETDFGTIEASSYEKLYEMLRAQEMESDLTAMIYMAGAYRDSSVLNCAVTALRKLQAFGKTVPARKSGVYATHPIISERIAFLKENFFIPQHDNPMFCGLDDNETVLTTQILGVSPYGKSLRFFIRISANDFMNKEGKVPLRASVQAEKGKKFNLGRSDYPRLIGRNQSRIFCYDLKVTKFENIGEIQEQLSANALLDLGNIGGGDDWEACTE